MRGDVQVLQGLNLTSDISVIKIPVEQTADIINFLEMLRGFHPLFFKEYKFEKENLYVYSQITFLWRELADLLITLSKGEITPQEAKKVALEEVIKQRLLSMVTIPVLYSSFKKGYEVTPTMLENKRLPYTGGFNRHYTIGVGKGSEILYSVSSSKDSKIGQTIQRDKWASNTIIQRMGLPIPKWQVIDDDQQIEKIWAEYNKPVVIKPVGLVGGNGVVTKIKTIEEAKEAFKYAKKATNKHVGKEWQSKIMIQEQVAGDDYRLLVINGHLEIATKRIPAFVTGNGKSTIQELIKEINMDPRRDTTSPIHTLKPIEIDDALLSYLKDQKLTLDYIPQRDEKIYVRKVASMSQGGITEDVTGKVCPEIQLIAESISASIHAFVLGIDILCKDLSKPLTMDNGGIIEINMMPEAYLNVYPVIGEPKEYVYEKLVDALVKDNRTKRIVVVGQSTDDIPTLLRKRTLLGAYIKKDDVVGEYKDRKIYLNGLEINKDLEQWQAIEGLKVNALLDAMIIHHRSVKEIEEYGFGFNKIDLLMVQAKYLEDKIFRKTIRRYKMRGLISKIRKF